MEQKTEEPHRHLTRTLPFTATSNYACTAFTCQRITVSPWKKSGKKGKTKCDTLLVSQLTAFSTPRQVSVTKNTINYWGRKKARCKRSCGGFYALLRHHRLLQFPASFVACLITLPTSKVLGVMEGSTLSYSVLGSFTNDEQGLI